MHLPALALTTAVAIGAFSLGAWTMQDSAPKRFTHAMPKDSDGGMARWMQSMQPGPAHARLSEILGNYDVTMRVNFTPGQAPVETKGAGEVKWLVEGKWLQLSFTVEMMGQPTKDFAILGYDNFKERFVWARVDSMQTTLQTAQGHFDQSGDALILWGTIDEPLTPEQDKQVKYVYRNFGQERFTCEVHDMMIGETNTKVIELVYTRKK